MDFSKLNEIANLSNISPLKKMSDLMVNSEYKITELKQVNTKHGMKIIATIDEDFDIFLPNRISILLCKNDEQFKELKAAADGDHLFLLYQGGQYNKCEFLFK